MAILDEDLVRVRGNRYEKFSRETKPGVIRLLHWGDEVEFVDPDENTDSSRKEVRVRIPHPAFGTMQEGSIRKRRKKGKYLPLRFRDDHLLTVTFVDVQQGDATLIRTPGGRTILVDGGEQKFISRLLAATFPFTNASKPLVLDALVVTHGDADHFDGLLELARAADHDTPRKRIHAKVLRFFHNGLVKLPKSVKSDGGKRSIKETDRFGKSVRKAGEVYVTDLWDDPREAPLANEPFTDWFEALGRLIQGVPQMGGVKKESGEKLPVVRRVEYGDDRVFQTFKEDGLTFQVLGPIVDQVGGKSALKFLRDDRNSRSMSHTINGHSVVLRMAYGNVHFMLGGDLNTHAEERLLERVREDEGKELRSEILKVPHHGSHEFAPGFLGQVAPVVSVVSSGDENVMKEYVHPRANLIAALGRASRGPEPLVFCTELAAFFAYRGLLEKRRDYDRDGKLVELKKEMWRGPVHGFERLVFGAVRVCTDGERVLVAVGSASDNVKEAYAFRVGSKGEITPDEFTLI